MEFITNIFSAIGNIITGPITEWQKRKTEIVQHKAKIAELEIQERISISNAKVELAKNGQFIEADWDGRAQEEQKNSWKDEFVLIVFSTPFIISFVPAIIAVYQVFTEDKDVNYITEAIKKSWENVSLAPDWYQYLLIGIVAGIYGLRWMFSYITPNKNKIVKNYDIDKNVTSKINEIK